jgi:hypothetical protein
MDAWRRRMQWMVEWRRRLVVRRWERSWYYSHCWYYCHC